MTENIITEKIKTDIKLMFINIYRQTKFQQNPEKFQKEINTGLEDIFKFLGNKGFSVTQSYSLINSCIKEKIEYD